MTTANIHLYQIDQNVQLIKPTGPGQFERMVSVARFHVKVGDQVYKDCTCEISQPPGTDHEGAPFEAGPPIGYPNDRPWNTAEFGDKLEALYRKVAPQVGPGVTNAFMMSNQIVLKVGFTIELPD